MPRFLAVAAATLLGTISACQDAHKHAPHSHSGEATQAVVVSGTKWGQLRPLVTDVNPGPAPLEEMEAIGPVGRLELDELWTLAKDHPNATRALGLLGDSTDLDRLVSAVEDGGSGYVRVAEAIGLYAARGGPNAADAVATLIDCSGPAWQRARLGSSADHRLVYSAAIGCIQALALQRSSKARLRLEALSAGSYKSALNTSGYSQRLRVNALANVALLNRLEVHGGSIAQALAAEAKNDPHMHQLLRDLGAAAQTLGISAEELIED